MKFIKEKIHLLFPWDFFQHSFCQSDLRYVCPKYSPMVEIRYVGRAEPLSAFLDLGCERFVKLGRRL